MSGGFWLARDPGSTITVTLSHSAQPFFLAAGIGRSHADSENPFDFTDMSGGSHALLRTVHIGDRIDLLIEAPGSVDDFVCVEMTISQTLEEIDLNNDGSVNLKDFALFGENLLNGAE